ncbi:kinesin-domain-containing protein [Schizopora paradoxa]|uniref:Kinesin-like protein n=1 Tax=Schizopora paradoxa TaxID=27342 RepID=A0A0H2RYP3_9AGAM|nr:kinesin-domain-containing protein [Schizopora paradoxa]
MATTTTKRLARVQAVPFTPSKRPLSVASSSSGVSTPRSSTPVNFPGTSSQPSSPKKIRSALSTESRIRGTASSMALKRAKTPTSLDVPSDGSRSRSTTPVPHSPNSLGAALESEMDVSRVDPESVLIDATNVCDDPDLSLDGEGNSNILDGLDLSDLGKGKDDKVLVSVRVRPSDKTSAWNVAAGNGTLSLLPGFTKGTSQPSSGKAQEFNYDAVHTGSANKPIYNSVARSHVCAAMEGYNTVIFAYGQTASGKTFTLSGTDEEPGIIPLALKDIFGYIRRTPSREYLLRCSYLEIYNEAIFDLLSPQSLTTKTQVQLSGTGDNVQLSPLREEVVTSLKSVREVLERGAANRRTACTDWNDRSSRSHSVFRVVIESRERGASFDDDSSGRRTPGCPPTPGGTRLQSRGGRSVQTSVLSLIDLAGSEKATSDRERTMEGRYINTSLLTLGSVIGTLAENAAKGKSDHVPFRNSKLTRMLQPSLSGNARISVICTVNPDANAVTETISTLLFAQRVKRVRLNAKKKEVVDTDALLQRYKKEIDDLKARLAEREAEAAAPVKSRRLSAKEQLDESRAMNDLNSRIRQLTKLILTSQTMDETRGDESRPASPSKLDFNLEPYQLQQELLTARRQLESQATQILSLEAALQLRPALPLDAPESEKDKLIAEQTKTIRELEIVVRGYEENLGEPLRQVREDVEKEWQDKVEEERRKRVETEAWSHELVRQLEKEKTARVKLDEQRSALAAFVTRFDALGLANATSIPQKLRQPLTQANSGLPPRRRRSYTLALSSVPEMESPGQSPSKNGPANNDEYREQPSLLEVEDMLCEDASGIMDCSLLGSPTGKGLMLQKEFGVPKAGLLGRGILQNKENVPLL